MKIGLALGSGAARGCAHIGVLRALTHLGLKPDIVTGCSIGAMVGAAYAAGNLDRFETWMRGLTRRQMLPYFELTFRKGGLIDTTAFDQLLVDAVCEEKVRFESLEVAFAAVATELRSGREVWLRDGRLLDAVRASIALPGLFRPIGHEDGWLIDGGLVNPVPVSVCRALGADLVIAVNLNADIVGKHFSEHDTGDENESWMQWWRRMGTHPESIFQSLVGKEDESPGIFDTLASAFNIMQDRITRSRMAGDPADITLTPRLSNMGLFEFYRAEFAIAEGKSSVERLWPEIEHVMARHKRLTRG